MEVFLPIAQVHVTAIEIILLSALVGVLSGLFGVNILSYNLDLGNLILKGRPCIQ